MSDQPIVGRIAFSTPSDAKQAEDLFNKMASRIEELEGAIRDFNEKRAAASFGLLDAAPNTQELVEAQLKAEDKLRELLK